MAAIEDKFSLEVVSPEGIVFNDEIDEVILPSVNGELAILPHHTPLFTKLLEGEIIVKKEGKAFSIAVRGGFLEIKENKVSVLSDFAVRAETIEIAKAEEKKQLSQKRMQESLGKQEFALAQKEFQKSILELKVAAKIKKRQRF